MSSTEWSDIKAKLIQPISALNAGYRVRKRLRTDSIKSIGEIYLFTEAEYQSGRYFGHAGVADLNNVLGKIGLPGVIKIKPESMPPRCNTPEQLSQWLDDPVVKGFFTNVVFNPKQIKKKTPASDAKEEAGQNHVSKDLIKHFLSTKFKNAFRNKSLDEIVAEIGRQPEVVASQQKLSGIVKGAAGLEFASVMQLGKDAATPKNKDENFRKTISIFGKAFLSAAEEKTWREKLSPSGWTDLWRWLTQDKSFKDELKALEHSINAAVPAAVGRHIGVERKILTLAYTA